jgi:anti-sigma factor ChrR (cupin superfamily)
MRWQRDLSQWVVSNDVSTSESSLPIHSSHAGYRATTIATQAFAVAKRGLTQQSLGLHHGRVRHPYRGP